MHTSSAARGWIQTGLVLGLVMTATPTCSVLPDEVTLGYGRSWQNYPDADDWNSRGSSAGVELTWSLHSADQQAAYRSMAAMDDRLRDLTSEVRRGNDHTLGHGEVPAKTAPPQGAPPAGRPAPAHPPGGDDSGVGLTPGSLTGLLGALTALAITLKGYIESRRPTPTLGAAPAKPKPAKKPAKPKAPPAPATDHASAMSLLTALAGPLKSCLMSKRQPAAKPPPPTSPGDKR